MSSDLSPYEKRILERYLARRKTPDKHPVKPPKSDPPVTNGFAVDAIMNGQTFYSNKKDSAGNWIGLPIALEQALKFAGSDGVVTMRELIAAKIKAKNDHPFWKEWYTVHTEENIGIDKNGRFYKPNESVLVIVNGGGLLTPDRIRKAYLDGLVNNSAKYSETEFNNLLEGELPDGTSLDLYLFEDVKKGVSLPHRFGVVMPYSDAQSTPSGYHKKEDFIENPLVIARNGGVENLEAYFDKAQSSNTLGNHHLFSGRDPSQPQGRLLFLNDNYDGLNGNIDLDSNGRFVGVAPEAHVARGNRP